MIQTHIKKIFIFGLGYSGKSVLEYFIFKKKNILVWDDNDLIRKEIKKEYPEIDICNPKEINWENVISPTPMSFKSCNISYSSFMSLKLRNLSIIECEIYEVDFTECDLYGTDFTKSDLNGSRFQNTNLENCNFSDAINYNINPNENKIKGSKFSIPDVLNLLNPFKIHLNK